MIEFNSRYIPALSENLTISSFDDLSYLVCIDRDEPVKLKISHHAKILIDQIDGIKKIEEIAFEFNKASGSKLSVETIIKIIKDQLNGFGVLKDDLEEKIKIKDNYLKLRMTILPKTTVRYLVFPLLFLFHKKTFQYIFLFCTVLLALTFMYKLDFKLFYANISIHFTAWFIALNILSIVFHELGHAGACEKFGAKTGLIGFGFYLFTPVFFTDVSDAWRLKKNERLIVDLSGIYMQLMFCSILLFIYFFSGNEFYLHTAFLIAVTVLIALNPFLRYDGYWAVTDLLNVPNLREGSNKTLKQFLKWLFRRNNNWNPTWKNIFLALYASASSVFILYFLVVLMVFNRNSILFFPANLYQFFSRLINGSQIVTFDWIKQNLAGFILPFIFYTFLFRMIKNKIRHFKFFKP